VEPCNYASNVAYFHSAVKICNYPDWAENTIKAGYVTSLKRTFSMVGSGSAFMHGSQTYVGGRFDNSNIALIAYIAL
jgi:hypothetical protein